MCYILEPAVGAGETFGSRLLLELGRDISCHDDQVPELLEVPRELEGYELFAIVSWTRRIWAREPAEPEGVRRSLASETLAWK